MSKAEKVRLSKGDRWMVVIFIFIVLAIIAIPVIAIVGLKMTNDFDSACREMGGVPVKGVCISQYVVLEVP